ncbi:MAG: extracellular solute-binding protein [Limnochordales bacterium]|nr:extracellular solute-binding protein [Limnochordales bacterium]
MAVFRRWTTVAFCLVIIGFLAIVGFAGMAEAAKVQVTYWTPGTGNQTYRTAQEGLEALFEKRYPDIDVKIEYVPSDIDQKLTIALASGTEPDLVTLPTRSAPKYIAQGLLAPIDFSAIGVKNEDGFLKLFIPGMRGILRSMGDYYFFPTEVSVFGLWYNEDMLTKAGLERPGATWQQLAQQSLKFIQRDPSGKWTQWGLMVMRGWIWPYFTWLTFARQAGGDWITPDGQPGFLDPRVVEAIQYYQDLYLRYRVLDPSPSLDVEGTIFPSGKAAFVVGVSYQLQNWKQAKVPFEVKSAPHPYLEGGRRSTVAYGYGNFVVATSKHKKEAWQVAKFFTVDNAENWFTKAGLFLPGAGDWIDELVKREPNIIPFLQELPYAQLEIVHPMYSDIRSAIAAADRDLIAGKSTREVLSTLNDKLKNILAQSAKK